MDNPETLETFIWFIVCFLWLYLIKFWIVLIDWFVRSIVFSGTPISSANKTDRHTITEHLIKVALNTITLTIWMIDWFWTVFSALFVTKTRLQAINHVGKKMALEWHYTSKAAGNSRLCTGSWYSRTNMLSFTICLIGELCIDSSRINSGRSSRMRYTSHRRYISYLYATGNCFEK